MSYPPPSALPGWYQPPPATPPGTRTFQLIALVTVLGTAALGLFSAMNAHANVPVIAPIVCAIKGGNWQPQTNIWAGVDVPGCYARHNG